MTQAPADPPKFRPKNFPPPEFPPRKLPPFARMPPAVFPPILGLLGLAIALREMAAPFDDWRGGIDLYGGMAVGLWGFAFMAYLAKLFRRPSVLMDEIRTLPGRTGTAAAVMGGLAAAKLLVVPMPFAAQVLLICCLVMHVALGLIVARAIWQSPPDAREVTPAYLLNFVGYILGAPAAVALGWGGLALGLFGAASVAAIVIMAISLGQIIRLSPPAPLRPLLAIHVAALSLLSITAHALGIDLIALGILALAGAVTLALVLALPYLTAAGFTPMWGAFTFPLAAFAVALFANGFDWTARAVTMIALIAIPVIAWKILRLWPTGVLAGKTNAATA